MTDSKQRFRDLIRYDSQEMPFVDRYAQFGVVFESGRPVGPGTLQVRSTLLYQPAADALLALWIEENGRLYPVVRRELESLPWEARERGSAATSSGAQVDVSATHVFLDETRLLSEFRFSSEEGAATLHPLFLGQLTPEQRRNEAQLRRYGIEESPGRAGFASVHAADTMVEGGLLSAGEPFLPSPAIRVRRADGLPATAAISLDPHWMSDAFGPGAPDQVDGVDGGAIFYQFDLGTVTVSAGQPESVRFVTELSVATYRRRQFAWKAPATVGTVKEAADASRKAFQERVRIDDPPAVEPAGMDRGWRARWALTRTGYQGGDGETGAAGEFASLIASTCVPSSHAFTRAFFWDALFSSAAMARFEPEFAKGAILAEFVRQDADGYCPEHSFNYHVEGKSVIGAPQAPVASWAVAKYVQSNPDDRAFLEAVYPILARNHRYWEVSSDRDRDGLAEWTWSGQTADNSPLWDEFTPQTLTGGCNWVPPVASVQLNSFLYRDAIHLARIAELLGNNEDSKRYRDRAGEIQEALFRVCYIPDEKRFWDYNHVTGRHSKVRTFYLCWPIWAGMDVPEDTKRDLIENVLLDPEQFFGPVPFPSVAYDDPRYDPKGYWRGKAWPQITYWLLEMLVAEGYVDAAKEAARRFLAVYDREPSFPENITSDPSVYNAGGVADYNWGIAAYYLITTGRYLE